MKCPNCLTEQKRTEGMLCRSCGYRFALDPKRSPYISDLTFKRLLDQLSIFGNYKFTYYQLYAQLRRHIQKSRREARLMVLGILGVFVLGFTVFFGTALVEFFIGIPSWLTLIVVFGLFAYLLHRAKRPASVSHATLVELIRSYRDIHSIDGLVDGGTFDDEGDQEEAGISHLAPERVLIVERNDIADMLLLNRFHLENKTLVLSAHKYPRRAFEVFQHAASENPRIPVTLMHDASKAGLRMEEDLLGDDSWGLEGKSVQDMGLFPEDLDRLDDPVWVPSGPEVSSRVHNVRTYPSAEENIQNGLKMPVDVAPPRTLMGIASVGLTVGAAMLSERFLTERRRHGAGGSAGTGAGAGSSDRS